MKQRRTKCSQLTNELGVSFLTNYFKNYSIFKNNAVVYIIRLLFNINFVFYLGRFLIKLVTVLQYGF